MFKLKKNKTKSLKFILSDVTWPSSCHQTSDFKAKMHQVWFRLGLRPRPRWGAHQTPLGSTQPSPKAPSL